VGRGPDEIPGRAAFRAAEDSRARFERLDHGTEGEEFQGGRVSVSYQFGGLHR
jgi:hypothetical protein